MNRWKWKIILPVAQLALAVFCHIYGPHQYRVEARRRRVVNNFGYYLQHDPAPVQRISLGLSFPALAVAYPLLEEQTYLIYSRNSAYTYISIAPKEIGFWAGVVVLWYGVGRWLDQCRRERKRGQGHWMLSLVLPVCGIVFAICIGAYAAQISTWRYLPWTQIGACGFVWCAILLTYFGMRLARELTARFVNRQHSS